MLTNWAGNVHFSTERLEAPTSEAELREVVARTPSLRCLGTAHSFSDVADTEGVLLSVARMPARVDVDGSTSTATVSAGTRWGDLAPVLHQAGYAIHNMGSLPHISIAGSCATGTHGSGDRLQCLAAAVAGLRIVTADGEVRTVRRGDPDFAAYVVSLGALGVVTEVTLDVQPTYDVRQTVFDRLPWDSVPEHLDTVMAAADSVSLFTTWRGAGIEQVWVKQRADTGAEPVDLSFTGAVRADGPRHPIAVMPTDACTDQTGTPGPWYTRLPHFRLEFTPSSGEELQTEYLLPRSQGLAALEAVDRLRGRIAPVLQISEIRTVAADDLWLSPAYGRDSIAVHFTWVPDTEAVLPVVDAVEEALLPLGARPHWGKVFRAPASALEAGYEQLPAFRALAARLDPEGKFRNAYLDRCLGAVPA
jgi:alditol oxidase